MSFASRTADFRGQPQSVIRPSGGAYGSFAADLLGQRQYRPSGLTSGGHTAVQRLMTLLNVTALPATLVEAEAEELLASGAEATPADTAKTLSIFVSRYCHSEPFLTNMDRQRWMHDNAWCPVANVPPVLCPPPVAFASEADRTAWMTAHPDCPPPPAYCPPPPSFRSAEERANWASAHSTCPVPAYEAHDDHVCPVDQPHCHGDLTQPDEHEAAMLLISLGLTDAQWAALATVERLRRMEALYPRELERRDPRIALLDRYSRAVSAAPIVVVAASAPAQSSFWKGVAIASAVAGGLWFLNRKPSAPEAPSRDNPPRGRAPAPEPSSAKKYVPIAIGGAAIVGAVILLKPASAGAMTSIESSRTPVLLPHPASHPATPAPPAADTRIAHGEQFTTPAPGTPAAIVQRLNSTPSSRPVFAFQALMYSYGATPYLPDGGMGPHTLAMIHTVDPALSTVTSDLYARAATQLAAGGHPLNKLIPKLPVATIRLVNQAIAAMAPGAPLLQVEAA